MAKKDASSESSRQSAGKCQRAQPRFHQRARVKFKSTVRFLTCSLLISRNQFGWK